MLKKLKKLKERMASKTEEPELALEAVGTSTVTAIDDQRVPDPLEDEDDGSSIEALAWSDFDEEEMELAKQLAEKEFPTSLPGQEKVKDQEPPVLEVEEKDTVLLEDEDDDESESQATEKNSTNSVLSISAGQILSEDDEPPEILDMNLLNNLEETEGDNADLELDPVMTKSTLSIASSSLTVPCTEDQASNAPVLDDGPIWAKGDKMYKFHENQRMNQKLTFGVLISVVLAVGIGLGNLVAYNEYEGESSKPIDPGHCPSSARSFPVHTPYEDSTESPNDFPMPAGFPSSTHIKDKSYTYNVAQVPAQEEEAVNSLGTETNTLAHVVKSIDDLSKKIDQFQNTTRQLSGIIVIKEESNTKFKQLPAKTRQNFDERLLPEFSDEILSWNVGVQQAKISDAVLDEQQEVKSAEADTRVPEVLPSELTTESDRLETIQPSKVIISTPEEVQVPNLQKQDIFFSEKNKKPSDKIKPEKKQDKLKKSKGEKGTLNPDQEKQDLRQSLDSSNSQKEYKRQKSGKKNKPDIENESPQNNDENNQKREKSVLKEEKRRLKRQNAVEFDFQKQGKKCKQDSTLDTEFKEKKVFESSIDESGRQDKKQKKVKADKPHGDKEEKKSKQSENDFILYESNNGREIKKSKKDYKKKKDENTERNLPKYKNRQRQEKEVDWEANRAELREKQRVYQNWESDFNTEDQSKNRRKRNQNWQIERDRIREKIRKTETD